MVFDNRKKGIICSTLAAVVFGTVPFFVTIAAGTGIDTYMLILLRNLFSLPLLWVFARIRGRKQIFSISGRDLAWCVLLMLLGIVFTLLLLFSSYALIGTAAATSLHFCYPVVILICGALFYKERIHATDLICFTLCVSGMALLYVRQENSAPIGSVMAIGSGVCYGLYSLLIEKSHIIHRLGNEAFLFWVNLLSVIPMLAVCLMTGRFHLGFSAKEYLLLIVIAVVDSILPATLYQTGVQLLGSRKAALLGSLEPVTSLLVGIVILKENVSVRACIGMILILAASVLLVVFSSKSENKTADQASGA